MDAYLDNPAWNALISGNENLAFGNEKVKHFDREVSPFAALAENSDVNFQILYELTTHTVPLLVITTAEMDIPAPWNVVRCIKGLQMVFDGTAEKERSKVELVPLSQKHVPQMLALTKLTNPGPFVPRTIEFGHYEGVFDGETLVAMAGQRLHVFDYMEISAVCTHPGHTGKGYARQLLRSQISRIKAALGVPFLHVRYDNDRAINVYESLGFVARRDIYFYAIKKNGTV
jgi:ribosomal protein S18 acetylase RimI-like enzyme